MTVHRLVPSLDCDTLDQAVRLVEATHADDFVHGYKAGFSLGLRYGLPAVVRAVSAHTDKPVVYDHQKAGTDIPDTGPLFADTLAEAGVTEAILFPQAGPATLRAWARGLIDRGIRPIVGLLMTHPAYLAREGGFLLDDTPTRTLAVALEMGVTDFVVPLTKPEAVEPLVRDVPPGCTFWSPGYGPQGGDPTRFSFLERHHLIVGRALLRALDPAALIRSFRRTLDVPRTLESS
ncbi:MAG: orotidine 5'-phosphate decarboxylase [Deltaproteobacteria bacterium]|nr:orotidine 5'-phosphate decarboxylase [Deltaproteobacteria bacterium]